MTRKEQIETAADQPLPVTAGEIGIRNVLYSLKEERQEAFEALEFLKKRLFIEGAQWADSNPVVPCQNENCKRYFSSMNLWAIKADRFEKALNKIAILQSGRLDYTNEFFEKCKMIVRSALKEVSQ